MTETTHLGVCNLCEAICGLQITVRTDDGPVGPEHGSGAAPEVVGIRGNPADPLSRGHICPKGVALADVYHDPDRLRRPIRRVGPGPDDWAELDWDDALDLVADRLAGVIAEHGGDAVGVYQGNPNAHSLGSATHGPHFVRSLGTRNRFSASTVDQIPHQFVAHWLYGHQLMLPVPDLDRTQLFVVIGANPMASNGSLMTVPDFPARVRELRARGGRMVVLDPRRTETARAADEHLFVRPGSDAAVLLALLHVVLTEGLARPPAFVDGLDAVSELVAPVTPEVAERVSGVSAEAIRRLARDLAGPAPAVVYGRLGVSAQGWGTVCQWALACLNIVSGHLDSPGGAMFPQPAVDTVGRRIVGPGHYDRWRSRVRGLPEFAGELPTAVLTEEMTTPGEGQIRAVVTVAGNPVLSTPDGAALDRALEAAELVVAIDIYLNETTRHAEVILPPTSALERDQYDLVFHGFAVRDTARWTPALFPRGEDQRHDWEIFAGLATRLAERLDRPLSEGVADQLAATPEQLVTLLLDSGGRTTMAELREHPEGVDLGPLTPCLPDRLQTPDQRIDLVPPVLAEEVRRFVGVLADGGLEPASATSETGGPGDLLLIGRRHQADCNSWLHNTTRLTRGRSRHQLLAHPDDLAARGIDDGSVVTVASRVGSVDVEVRASTDVMVGVVSLPHGYGHGVAGTRLRHAREVPGVSINDLTDPERLDVTGNAALNGVPVRLTAAAVSRESSPSAAPARG